MKFRYLGFIVVVLFFITSCNRPMANFSLLDKKEYHAPSKVTFKNQSEKAEIYLWNFGDGDTSSLANPTHKYTMSGNYTVELIAKKGNKVDKKQKQIHIQAPEICLVLIETPFGEMQVELYDETPKHRDNFIKLAEKGFYENLLFHRIINGFMIQGGDPKSKGASKKTRLGSGGPGYQIDAEFNPELVHLKGALAAARMGDGANPERKSSGSQFYIVQGSKLTDAQLDQIEQRKGIHYSAEQRKAYKEIGGTPFLDMDYTVYGRVIKGFDVIDKMSKVKKDRADRPEKDVWMKVKVIK